MLGNWVRQTTTTTGTGALTLSTVSGYAAFSSHFAESQRFGYAIVDDSTGAPIESGIGYLSSGTLVREYIEATMVSGTLDITAPTAVSLAAGTKRVVCAASAGLLIAPAPGIWNNVAGRLYGDPQVSTSVSTITMVADRAYALPFIRAVNRPIDAVSFRVNTAGAGGTLAKCAIFSWGSDGLPGVKLAETATVAVDATGVKTPTFSAAFDPPQRFFVAILSDGAPILQGYSGCIPAFALGVSTSMQAVSFLHHVGATGLTFPTTWTAVENLSNAVRPSIGLRCTS